MTSLTDILTAIQNTVTALNNLNTTINAVFPHVTGTTNVPPGVGGLTFSSSQPTAFFLVTSSSGHAFKIPAY